MRIPATLLGRLPKAPITPDQLTMLELGDNVAADDSAQAVFDVPLVPLDDQLRQAV
jgi:hypothetical protein